MTDNFFGYYFPLQGICFQTMMVNSVYEIYAINHLLQTFKKYIYS